MPSAGWVMRAPGAPRALQLFAFSAAGGSASSFLAWQAALAPEVEVCAVVLPGRGPRLHEAPIRRLPELLEGLADVVALESRGPFAFLGHSLGALIAFELARLLRRRGLPMPERLFALGCGAPPARTVPRRLHELDDEALIEELRRYNGTPPEALAHRELMDLLLPAVRADFELLAGYRYREEAPLPTPIALLAGTRDPLVAPASLERWQECSVEPCETRWFDGDHFFLNHHATDIARHVKQALSSSERRTP